MQAEIFPKFLRSTRVREDKVKFILSGLRGIHKVVMSITALSAINDLKKFVLNG